jgi:hypothetical protein
MCLGMAMAFGWFGLIKSAVARVSLRICLATIILSGLFGSAAYAQPLLDQYIATDIPGIGIEPGVTVLSRQRPEYDPLGINLGEVTIRPELLESVGFDDNVLGQPGHRGSAVIETNARVQALYDHSDTTGFVNLNVDDNRYLQQNSQSYTNWSASVGGTHSFGRDTLSFAYDHLNLNQTTRDLDVPQLNNALAYRVDTVRVDYRTVFSRFFVQPGLTVSNFAYDNGTAAGQPYIQNYRDRVVVQPSVTLGYELLPRENLVLVVRDATGRYSNQIAGMPSRNYNDFAILGGVDFESGGIWRYRLLAGYETRQFSSSQIDTIQAPIVEAEVIWNPTGLTTLTASASRHVEDSAAETTVGYTETAVGLRVDHELRRNVLLRATASYLSDDYSQNQGHQDLYGVGTAATWLLNRNMALIASYDFARRTSNAQGNINDQAFGSSYSESRYLLQVRLAL